MWPHRTHLCFFSKMRHKSCKKKLWEIVVGRPGQVRNVTTDLPKSLRIKSGWYMAAMSNAGGVGVGLICCILLQISRCIATFRWKCSRWPNFAVTGIPHGAHISSDLRSERLWQVRKHITDFFRPSPTISDDFFSSFRCTFLSRFSSDSAQRSLKWATVEL